MRQEAASLSGSLGSSSSPPPHDRVKRDISPKSVDLGGLPSGIRYPEVAQNRQIAYSGALRGPPSRRRLPQVCDNRMISRYGSQEQIGLAYQNFFKSKKYFY